MEAVTKKEKALRAEARKSAEKSMRRLIEEAGKSSNRGPSNPDYAQAFGIAQGLFLAGVYEIDPGRCDSEFKKLRDEVEGRK